MSEVDTKNIKHAIEILQQFTRGDMAEIWHGPRLLAPEDVAIEDVLRNPLAYSTKEPQIELPGDDWVRWCGSYPVVEVLLRNGNREKGSEEHFNWDADGDPEDIVAYRIVSE